MINSPDRATNKARKADMTFMPVLRTSSFIYLLNHDLTVMAIAGWPSRPENINLQKPIVVS